MAIYAPRLTDMNGDFVKSILNKKFDVGGVIWSCKQVTYSPLNDIISMHFVDSGLGAIVLQFGLEQIETCRDVDSLVIQEIRRRYIGAINIETGSLNAANITSLSMPTTITAITAPTVITNTTTNTGTQKEETMSLRKQADFYARKAAEIAALAEEIENKFGTDSDYENGAILWADIIYASNADKVYNYAFIKADGKWFSTGRVQFGRTWDDLMDWFTADESKTIKAFGFAEQVYKFKTKKNGTVRYY